MEVCFKTKTLLAHLVTSAHLVLSCLRFRVRIPLALDLFISFYFSKFYNLFYNILNWAYSSITSGALTQWCMFCVVSSVVWVQTFLGAKPLFLSLIYFAFLHNFENPL